MGGTFWPARTEGARRIARAGYRRPGTRHRPGRRPAHRKRGRNSAKDYCRGRDSSGDLIRGSMLLAIDIGNTNIVLGLYQGKKLITHWRLLTVADRTADEYGVIISHLVSSKGFRCNQIRSIVASCVVPPMVSMTQELAV